MNRNKTGNRIPFRYFSGRNIKVYLYIVLCILSAGCGDDEITMTVNTQSLVLPPLGGEASFTVTTNADYWSVVSNASWLSVTRKGTSDVKIQSDPCLDASRSATVVCSVAEENILIEVTVRQSPVTALQSEYSIWYRAIEDSVLPTCEALEIGLVPYSPLGRGYLTGKIDETTTFDPTDIRSNNPRFTPEAIKANRVVVDLLEQIGAQKGATPAQIALAWLLAQKPWIVPIPGSRKLERLDENIGAVDVELNPEDLLYMDRALSQITVVGNRY